MAISSKRARANFMHIFNNQIIVFVDSTEMVMKAEDASLRFICKESVKLISRSYRGCDGDINRRHESILDHLILMKPILVLRVVLQVIGGDFFRRGHFGTVKMTIEVMSMKQHDNLGLPYGKIMAVKEFNRQLVMD